jgi:chromosome segregation ATPase
MDVSRPAPTPLHERTANAPPSAAPSSERGADPFAGLVSRDDILAYGRRLIAEGGADRLQAALKDAISRCRGADVELVNERRAADAAQKTVDAAAHVGSVYGGNKTELRASCAALLASNEKLEKMVETNTGGGGEDARLEAVREKFEAETRDIAGKAEKQAAEAAALRETNAALRAEFETKKREFDERIQAKISAFKESEGDTAMKLATAQTTVREHALLQERVARDESALSQLTAATTQLRDTAAAFRERVDELRTLAATTEETLALFATRRSEQAQLIASLEQAKRGAADETRELLAKTHKLRTVASKELRKRVANLEKQCQALETRCRDTASAGKAAKA